MRDPREPETIRADHDQANTTWLDRLTVLLARYPEHGSGPDVAALSTAERWGLYLSLRRIARHHPRPQV